MKQLFFIGAAALLLAGAAPAVAATTLDGSTVSVTLLYPDTDTVFSGPATGTVPVALPNGTFSPAVGSFNISGNQVTFNTDQVACCYLTASFNGYRVSFSGLRVLSAAVDVANSTFFPTSTFVQNGSFFFDVSGQAPNGGSTTFNVVAAAVPEPATWAMMIGGFGMVGGAMRSARRRQKVSVSYA
jgi:hypothetical protein